MAQWSLHRLMIKPLEVRVSITENRKPEEMGRKERKVAWEQVATVKRGIVAKNYGGMRRKWQK